jgi:hypothetical protein
MRGAFTGLGDKIMGAIAEPGLKRESDAKTAKVQEFVTKYNNPNDADFDDMQGSQRALKLSRLLLPLDPTMSEEWSKRSFAMAQEEKSSGTDLEKLKEKHLNELELARLKQSKPKEAKEVERTLPTTLYPLAIGAFEGGTYPEFYESLNPLDKNAVASPAAVTREKLETMANKSFKAGATLGNEIDQSKYKTVMDKEGATQAPLETTEKTLGAGEATIGLEQIKTGADGMYVGVPKTLEPQVSSIKSEYIKSVAPLASAINESSKLISLLGDGKSPITGTRAIAAVIGFMKALDPGSTVRESEFDTVAGAQGAFGRFINLAGQLNSGLTLSVDQAKDMIQLATVWKKTAELKMQDVKKGAEDLANGLKVQSKFVTGQGPAVTRPTFIVTGKGPVAAVAAVKNPAAAAAAVKKTGSEKK